MKKKASAVIKGVGIGMIAGGATAVAGSMMMGSLGVLIAGCSAIIGHMFPLYFRFKGGKGILVGGTMIAVFDWRIFCIVMLFFFFLVGITKWVSLGSIVATSLVPFFTLFFYRNDPNLLPMAVILFVVASGVVYMHRGNIVRIAQGKENKFTLHSGKSK